MKYVSNGGELSRKGPPEKTDKDEGREREEKERETDRGRGLKKSLGSWYLALLTTT